MSVGPTIRTAWIWGPVAAYLGLIYYLSAQSSIGWAEPYPDVVLHALEYSVLGVLLARGINGGLGAPVPDRRVVLTWALCVVYAVSDELHQAFVPGRNSDWRDVLSDAAGTAVALASLCLVQRHLPWRRAIAAARGPGVISADAPFRSGGERHA